MQGEGENFLNGRDPEGVVETSPNVAIGAGQGVLQTISARKNRLSKGQVRSTRSLKCLYTNAQSMGNKQEELELLIHQNKYDIIGITETWWDETYDWNVVIGGYNLFQRNRPSKKGGGVALYIKDIYTAEEIQDKQ